MREANSQLQETNSFWKKLLKSLQRNYLGISGLFPYLVYGLILDFCLLDIWPGWIPDIWLIHFSVMCKLFFCDFMDQCPAEYPVSGQIFGIWPNWISGIQQNWMQRSSQPDIQQIHIRCTPKTIQVCEKLITFREKLTHIWKKLY